MNLDFTHNPQIKCKTGDDVAAWPINPDVEVNRLLEVLGLEERQATPISVLSPDPANTKLKIPTPTNSRALFQHYLEICALVSCETVLPLAQFAPSLEIKTILLSIGQDKGAYAAFLASDYMTFGRLLDYTITTTCSIAAWNQLSLPSIIETLPPCRLVITPSPLHLSSIRAPSP